MSEAGDGGVNGSSTQQPELARAVMSPRDAQRVKERTKQLRKQARGLQNRIQRLRRQLDELVELHSLYQDFEWLVDHHLSVKDSSSSQEPLGP